MLAIIYSRMDNAGIMGIEFIERQITDEQVVIPRTMRSPELSTLKNGECTFIADTSLWMDTEGRLWVDALAISLKDLLPGQECDFVRVMKLPEGYVVDISQVVDAFTDDETGEFQFTPQDAPETVADGFAFIKAPIIGLLVSDGEVELFRELVSSKHSYDYPEVVSAPED